MKKLACILAILAFAANTFAASAGIACAGRISKTTGGYEITYFITDHLGSTRAIVNSNGDIVAQYNYYPFGKQWEDPSLMANTNRYTFSGKEKQITGDINYMDFGSRMYDDFLGRWFAIDPRAEDYYPLSPYAYCGNNPVNIIDTDGKGFFSSLWGAVSGFWKGIFNLNVRGKNFFEKLWNGVKDVAKSTWNGLKNGFKIDMGWLKGDFGQILSRFTWELPQTLLGYASGVAINTVFGVNSVTYYGGATVIETKFKKMGAFTLGSYINIDIREGYSKSKYEPDGKFTVVNDPLFMHEYGHYLQSQAFGWGYISKIAIPSFIDAIANGGNHDFQSFEQDANRRAFMFFNENVEGFYQTEAEYWANSGINSLKQ